MLSLHRLAALYLDNPPKRFMRQDNLPDPSQVISRLAKAPARRFATA